MPGAYSRSRFDTRRINSIDNLVAVPDELNDKLNYHYGSKDKLTGVMRRDWPSGKPWDLQYQYGCQELDRKMKEMWR